MSSTQLGRCSSLCSGVSRKNGSVHLYTLRELGNLTETHTRGMLTYYCLDHDVFCIISSQNQSTVYFTITLCDQRCTDKYQNFSLCDQYHGYAREIDRQIFLVGWLVFHPFLIISPACLSDPTFVHAQLIPDSAEKNDDKLYFFFREKASEMGQTPMTQSRIGRICLVRYIYMYISYTDRHVLRIGLFVLK